MLKLLCYSVIIVTPYYIISMNHENFKAEELIQVIDTQVRVKAYQKLTNEQKDFLSPDHYASQKEQAIAILKLLASYVIKEAVLAGKITETDPEKLKSIEVEYAAYLINLRETVLFSQSPIEVIDEKTARAHAAQLLTLEEKNALQRTAYLAHKDKAIQVIDRYAELVSVELAKKGLMPNTVSVGDFKAQIIADKIRELDQAYTAIS